MKPVLKDQQHRNLTFWGMAMIVMGLPLSVVLVSIGSFVLAGSWLLEGNHLKRLKQFFSNPLSLAITSLFFIHVIGMAWTSELGAGLHDLRIKLPLLLMPLFLFTSKLPNKQRLQDLLLTFVLACLVGTLFGTARYFELSGEPLLDTRELSVFISHIQFSLMLVLAFFVMGYLLFAKWSVWSVAEQVVAMLSMLQLGWFMVILEAFTAYITFAMVLGFTALWLLFRLKNKKLSTAFLITTVAASVVIGLHSWQLAQAQFNEVPTNPKAFNLITANGNEYWHQTHLRYKENGHRVWNYMCWKEIIKEWPQRSDIDIEGKDRLGQPIKYTAIRYMTSLGLKKDSAGVHQLSDSDIENIEKGITNHLDAKRSGISKRISQFFWTIDQYRWNNIANNSSNIQRWVYLKVGRSIFDNNWLFGVGTGDVLDEYQKAYKLNDHGLEARNQRVSHNQYLTIGIALGVLGLQVFFFSLAYPAWLYRRDYLYLAFLVLMLTSFLTDNNLERQSGVTMFAFFNAFLILRREFVETGD